MRFTPAFVFLILSTPSLAQNLSTKFGIKFGPNFSVLSEPINGERALKSDYHIGVFLYRQTTEKFTVRPEMYFSRQGQKNYVKSGNQTVVETSTVISALNIPLLFEYGRKVTFHVGPQIGILLHAFEKGTSYGNDYYEDQRELINPVDWSVVVGGGVNVTDKLHAGLRYNYAFTSSFHRPPHVSGLFYDPAKISSRVIHIYLGYSFK